MVSLPQVTKQTIPCDNKDHLLTHGGAISNVANLGQPLLGNPTFEFWTCVQVLDDSADPATAGPAKIFVADHIYRVFLTGVDIPGNYWYKMTAIHANGTAYHLFERI